MCAQVPDLGGGIEFVGLVYGIDGGGDFPGAAEGAGVSLVRGEEGLGHTALPRCSVRGRRIRLGSRCGGLWRGRRALRPSSTRVFHTGARSNGGCPTCVSGLLGRAVHTTYVEVTGAVVVPAGHAVDEPRGVNVADVVGENAVDASVADAVVLLPGLAPAFVVDDLIL